MSECRKHLEIKRFHGFADNFGDCGHKALALEDCKNSLTVCELIATLVEWNTGGQAVFPQEAFLLFARDEYITALFHIVKDSTAGIEHYRAVECLQGE